MQTQLFSFKKTKPDAKSMSTSSVMIPTPQTQSKKQPVSLNITNVMTAKKVYPPLRIMKCNLMKLEDISFSNKANLNATYIYQVICRIVKVERQGKLLHLSCVDDTASNKEFDIAIVSSNEYTSKYKVNSYFGQQKLIRPQMIECLQFQPSTGKGTPYFKLIMRLQRIPDYQQMQYYDTNPQESTHKIRFVVQRMERIIGSNQIAFQMLEIMKANW